jgi:hypothetical protein
VKWLAASAGPILATSPMSYNCAVLDDESIKCWGADTPGLGIGSVANAWANKGDQPGEMGAALATVNLGTGKKAKAVSVGMALAPQATMTCALLVDGDVKCWGRNENGTLGVGDTDPRGEDVATMGDALLPIDLGPGHKAKSVAVGSSWQTYELAACAILDDDRLKCWGTNKYGQLGYGDSIIRGATPESMGAGLPYVDLGL